MSTASIPSTPSKKADEDINRLIDDLEQRYNLQLPIRDPTWSPAKNTNASTDQQILSCIKYLYFKDRSALTSSIEQFEGHASAIGSKWIFKPKGEPDTLPRHQAAKGEETLVAEADIDDKKSLELKECLLEKLRVPYDDIKHGKRKIDGHARTGDQNPTASPKLPQPRRIRTPKASAAKEPVSLKSQISSLHLPSGSPTTIRHPSSDEFPLTQEDLLGWTDLSIPDVAMHVEPSDSSGEDFRTPPSEPLDDNASGANFLFRIPDHVPTAAVFSKKRPCPDPESTKPPSPQKVSREKCDWQLSHDTHKLQPMDSMPPPHIPNAGIQTGNSTSRSFTRSFGSSTSLTASSTTTTTAATSFASDSVGTSFDSSLGNETVRVPIEARLSGNPADYARDRHSIEPRSNTEEDFGSSTDFESMPSGTAAGDSKTLATVLARKQPETRANKVSNLFLNDSEDVPVEIRSWITSPNCVQYLEENLVSKSPTGKQVVQASSAVPFRQRYEVERIARSCKLSQADLLSLLERPVDEYNSLWASLSTLASKLKITLPERSSIRAWSKAQGDFRGVSLSGELDFVEQAGGAIFDFSLRPFKADASYRLARKFGGDRIFTLSIPGLDADDLPKYLRSSSPIVRKAIIDWIVDSDHYFLGRKWRAFFVRPEPHKKSGRRASINKSQPRFRIFMFAEDSDDFLQKQTEGEIDPRNSRHTRTSVKDMINWFMPAVHNSDQRVLKFFSRLALSVSNTKPTIVFRPAEIIRSDDASAEDPQERRLNIARSEEKRMRGGSGKAKETTVMNDGCARLSKAAANGIAEQLGLTHTPAVFQGRIGGAKGMWMIDTLDEHLPSSDHGYWIEIADSQLKFNGHPEDDFDDLRFTFEVHDYSRKLCPAALNFQFIPILEDRGVPQTILQKLLEDDLTSKVAELKEAMSDPGSLRRWNQENNSVAGERLANDSIEMLAGLPKSLADRINWFVEHGFHPQQCDVLKDFCYRAIHEYCTTLENRMHIGIGRSTSAFMIADPLAILEEDEVHVGFSSLFQDPKSIWSDVMLHDMDILVARSPALLPSDIQKVRAVFKTELRLYKDVIVFSSKGDRSLADKLSGGDYDGDKAWICWEPDIVKPFRSAPVPPAPSFKYYGIEESGLKVQDIIDQPDYLSRFLHHSFEFNLQPDLLGSCTAYHEALCYWNRNMHHGPAIKIAHLLGKLVDRAKAGFIFDRAKWNSFLRQHGLEPKLKKPAYKNKGRERPTKHIIDRLVFEVAAGVRERALKDFTTTFAGAGSWDDDLARIWGLETQRAKHVRHLAAVREDLKSGLERIFAYWKDNVAERGDDFDMRMPSRRGTAVSFRALVEHCRSEFLALKPLADINHPVVERWRSETEDLADVGKSWRFIKASAMFWLWHRSGKFVWYVAGPELGEIKAKSRGLGSYHIIVGDLYDFYKLDGKMLRRKQGREGEAEQWGIEEKESDYGSDIEDFGAWNE